MIPIIIIACISIALMIVLIIFFPKLTFKRFEISTFWIAPLLGAIIIICFQLVDITDLWNCLIAPGNINPLEILALFLSMTFMSIVLDEIGFFEKLASLAIKIAKGSQIGLFIVFYLLISILTIFTSNDIIIVTFTPFIIFFAKNAKINPLPYLISEFVAANTWSMLLLIGNPTNIYLASTFSINFFDYIKIMYLPTIFAGIISFVIMFVLFYKQLKKPLEIEEYPCHIKDHFVLICGLIFLFSTIILMSISSIINIPIWLICSIAALTLIVILLIYAIIKKDTFYVLKHSVSRLPYSIIPFILSMFVIVFAFSSSGISSNLATLLDNNYPILSYGTASYLSANLINNIPMSVLFSNIISYSSIDYLAPTYATIISSNVSAFLTPIGALAGIMWMSIIKRYNINFSFLKFTLYGLIISIPSLLMAFLGLFIVLL